MTAGHTELRFDLYYIVSICLTENPHFANKAEFFVVKDSAPTDRSSVMGAEQSSLVAVAEALSQPQLVPPQNM